MQKYIKSILLILSVFILTLSSVYAATIKGSLQNKAGNFVNYICYSTPMTGGYYTCIMKNLVHSDSFGVVNTGTTDNSQNNQNTNNNTNINNGNGSFYGGNLVVNAKCGSAAGQTFSNTPYYNLCELGTPTQVTANWSYKWSCIGDKGEAISCSAGMSNGVGSNSDGVCGEANGKTYDSPPSIDKLCSSGNPEGLVGVGPWVWRCAGPKSAVCISYKKVNQTICSNNTKDNNGNNIIIHKADWSRQDKGTDAVLDEKSCDYASFESHFYRSGNWCLATVSPGETHSYEFTNGLYPSINISTEGAYHGAEISISECPGDFENIICKPRAQIAGSIRTDVFGSKCGKIQLGKKYYLNISKPSSNGGADSISVVTYNNSGIMSYSLKPKEHKLDPTDINGNKFSQTKSWTGTLNKDGLYILPFTLSSYNEGLAIKSGNNNSSKYVTYSISENPGDFENTINTGYRIDLWSGFRSILKFGSEAGIPQTPTYGQIKAELGKQYYLNIKIQYEGANPNFDNTGNIAISIKEQK